MIKIRIHYNSGMTKKNNNFKISKQTANFGLYVQLPAFFWVSDFSMEKSLYCHHMNKNNLQFARWI